MENKHALLGNSLFQALAEIREMKGKISVEDAGQILEQLLESQVEKKSAYLQIAQIVKDIEQAKSEILSLNQNKHTNQKALSEASKHLSTVIQSTEEATMSFLNEAENIRKIAEEMGGEKEQALNDACLRIYELCSFQDLTGQRITKVIKLVQTLESHIINLLRLFGLSSGDAPASRASLNANSSGDEELLNGPKLPGDTHQQEEIDRLLKSFE